MTASHASPLHAYHSEVMQAMCSQMVNQQRRPVCDQPLPFARKSSLGSGEFDQTLQEEMARRVKADRVLQDLSSDKSRQQARAREMARRNKWAKSIISTYPIEAANSPALYTDTRYDPLSREMSPSSPN